MVCINLNKDINKESYIEPVEGIQGRPIGCIQMKCIGNHEIDCERCIFADDDGVVITNPIKQYTLDTLKELGRVQEY